jgi:hypothetical protein
MVIPIRLLPYLTGDSAPNNHAWQITDFPMIATKYGRLSEHSLYVTGAVSGWREMRA